MLNYGRKRSIILEAPGHDEHCVLGNILAAHYLSSTGSSKASCFLQAAKSHYVKISLALSIIAVNCGNCSCYGVWYGGCDAG